jgi:hypothetical protein
LYPKNPSRLSEPWVLCSVRGENYLCGWLPAASYLERRGKIEYLEYQDYYLTKLFLSPRKEGNLIV